MPEIGKPADSASGDGDSRRGVWNSIRRLFEGDQGEPSLRAQLEEAIEEHQEEHPAGEPQGANGDLSPVELTMLRNLLHFSEHDADDVAIPRGEIVAIAADASWTELVATFAEHGHSRIPVYRGTLDEVIGMMHIKDVFPFLATGEKPPEDWTALMRQPLYVPQARNALDVLADMRAQRTHLAVVVNEYSGVDGIITIEDLVEEIVGEIEDEHDEEPEELIVAIGEGMWDAAKVGIAGPPMKVSVNGKDRWLLIYHGVSRRGRYRLGAALLAEDGVSVLARSADPIFEPVEKYEIEGEVGSVVFSCGSVIRGDTLYVYYGGGDKVLGVATGSVSRILAALS